MTIMSILLIMLIMTVISINVNNVKYDEVYRRLARHSLRAKANNAIACNNMYWNCIEWNGRQTT